MSDVTYTIVEHDGGYAYKVGDTFSETFSSHQEAADAARVAASEQQVPGSTEGILYQDRSGAEREETAEGDDRPVTHVEDKA